MKKFHFPVALLILTLVFACKKEPVVTPPAPIDQVFESQVAPYLNISPIPPDYTVTIDAGYTQGMLPTVQADPYKAQLGRVIFYEKHLSDDKQIACASCHRPENAFGDPDAQSTGIYERKTFRNSMPLTNSLWLGALLGFDSTGNVMLPLFWDSRAFSVADQSTQAFTNPTEMGIPIAALSDLVRQKPYYGWLFEKAWGDTAITNERVFVSLSHFLSSIGARNTIFDQAMKEAGGVAALKSNFPSFSTAENRGKELFLEHCESCHGSLTSVQHIFEANNGLESPYIDEGKGAITGNFYERGIFRVPGLRNVAQSAPYMHDGRFATLDEVVEHYNSGVKQVFGLHGDLLTFNPVNQTYSPKRLNLSAEDKQALVQFLHTLTDAGSLNDPRYSNPFK